MNTHVIEKKKILLVDGDKDFLRQMKKSLQEEGHEVITALTEVQALEIINSQEFDVAVTELMLEEMDSGFVLSYEIKKKYPQMPVVIVTSVRSELGFNFEFPTENEKKWIKADAILTKPVRSEQILQEIHKIHKHVNV